MHSTKFISLSTMQRIQIFPIQVWNIWDKGRQPRRATLRHTDVTGYYDVLEEIGR